MKPSFVLLMFSFALTVGCVSSDYRAAGRLAILEKEGARLGLSSRDQLVIETLVSGRGDVKISAVEKPAADKIKISSETFESVYPIYEDVLVLRNGEWKIDPEEAVMILTPLGQK